MIHVRARLTVAIELLRGCDMVADIGCDHGKLACALIQQNACRRCIAADISAPSLEKARTLVGQTGLSDRVDVRLGDGFGAVRQGEADGVALLGMGGTLMAELLSGCETPLHGAKRAVLQPMRGVCDIRSFLYENGYRIPDDRVVLEGGRYYQVFSVLPPKNGPEPLPAGWPEGCHLFGYRAFARREPLLKPLVEHTLSTYEERLTRTQAPALLQGAAQMRTILQNWEDETDAAQRFDRRDGTDSPAVARAGL